MWIWIVILLVAAGGLALWMGTRKQEGDDETAAAGPEEPVAPEAPEPVETPETPEVPETPETVETPEAISEETPPEEPKDEDKPASM